MPRYTITEKAGPFVAGRNNTGAGTDLFLSEKEAEYELSLGTLIDAEKAAEETRIAEAQAEEEAKALRLKAEQDEAEAQAKAEADKKAADEAEAEAKKKGK